MRYFLVLFFTFFVTACSEKDDIQVYRLAKDKIETEETLKWNAPSSWDKKQAEGMRQGSYEVDSVDISLIRLKGSAGGDLANVNRWRQQIGLPPWDEATLKAQTDIVSSPAGKIKVVEFSNSKQRIVAATLPFGEVTWFVKMIGSDEVVAKERKRFIQFLETLHS